MSDPLAAEKSVYALERELERWQRQYDEQSERIQWLEDKLAIADHRIQDLKANVVDLQLRSGQLLRRAINAENQASSLRMRFWTQLSSGFSTRARRSRRQEGT